MYCTIARPILPPYHIPLNHKQTFSPQVQHSSSLSAPTAIIGHSSLREVDPAVECDNEVIFNDYRTTMGVSISQIWKHAFKVSWHKLFCSFSTTITYIQGTVSWQKLFYQNNNWKVEKIYFHNTNIRCVSCMVSHSIIKTSMGRTPHTSSQFFHSW